MSFVIDLSNPDNDNDIKIEFDRSWVTAQLNNKLNTAGGVISAAHSTGELLKSTTQMQQIPIFY